MEYPGGDDNLAHHLGVVIILQILYIVLFDLSATLGPSVGQGGIVGTEFVRLQYDSHVPYIAAMFFQ